MKRILHLVLALLALPYYAFSQPIKKGLDSTPCQERALMNSLRCMETIHGDEYRTALTQIFVAQNLAYFKKADKAEEVLRAFQPHFAIPFGCVDSALILVGYGEKKGALDLVSLGIELLPYASGRGSELVQFQLLKLATIMGDSSAVQRAFEAEKITNVDLRQPYQLFIQDWKPSIWNRILDSVSPGRHWKKMPTGLNREGEIQWHAKRAVDVFTALLFIKVSEYKFLSGEKYPAHWIEFAAGAGTAESFNTKNISVQMELANLALIEGKASTALTLVENTSKLLIPWAPHMSGIYPLERDLALLLSKLDGAAELRQQCKERILKRVDILKQVLEPNEQMTHLPFLGEALYALGDTQEATSVWKTAAELCAKNQNPESQSIGLTRIWMSFARANCLPEKTIETLLQKIETKLPEEYTKVHF
jgi:tetratricopeptide (TPR) repeat protein